MDKGKEKKGEASDPFNAWVAFMTERAQGIACRPSQTQPCTIYRVPQNIRLSDADAYEPRIISFGPYHRDEPRLQAMQKHKWEHLHAAFARDPHGSLGDYINEVRALEEQARSCYSEDISLESYEFVEMMVLDGCFIIELFVNVAANKTFEGGPIYSTKWMVPLIAQDMLRMENQIPFFVLERLFQLFNRTSPRMPLVGLALNFFDHIVPTNKSTQSPKAAHHLLHLLHAHLLPTPPDRNKPGKTRFQVSCASSNWAASVFHRAKSSVPPRTIPSITEIRRAGIKFKKKRAAESFLDVTFEKGVIQMPTLTIYDSTTNTIFRNMIAFEQCCPRSGTYFTSYATFMYCILETTKDATTLKQSRIVEHWLGSDEEVVRLFKGMCKGMAIDFDDNYLSGLIKHVAEVCETDWHTWRATLMRDYFSSPWSILQLEAAVLTFVFTLVQTTLAVLEYYHPRPGNNR
ncbi:hypothetical protein ACLOJK_026497 [Asimina triloba]